MQTPPTDVLPWYRQFWPWFLIVLLMSVVTACLFTVYLAFSNPLNMVKKDYYKEGLTINKNFKQLRQAKTLALSADVRVIRKLEKETNIFQVSLKSKVPIPLPNKIKLHFIHPLNTTKDQFFELQQVPSDAGYYTVPVLDKNIDALLSIQRWYIEVSPSESPATWLLTEELQLKQPIQFLLSASAKLDPIVIK